MCGWKNIWKYVKYYLKIENCYQKTHTKHTKYYVFQNFPIDVLFLSPKFAILFFIFNLCSFFLFFFFSISLITLLKKKKKKNLITTSYIKRKNTALSYTVWLVLNFNANTKMVWNLLSLVFFMLNYQVCSFLNSIIYFYVRFD